MIKHCPNVDIEKVIEHYSKKDGVPITYVCTSALCHEEFAMDIFYRSTPHPTFGNRYFGLYTNPISGNLMITNADKIEEASFAMIKDSNQDYHYSQHRHDYKVIEKQMIDGGRSYARFGGGRIYGFVVKDGNFVEEKFDV